jgi:5-methylthioadenosine/S-adenosylhomocysteine deaminase
MTPTRLTYVLLPIAPSARWLHVLPLEAAVWIPQSLGTRRVSLFCSGGRFMIETFCLRRLAIAAFVLTVWTGLFCSVSLAESAKTLIRNAALILTMDSSVGSGDLGIVEHADVLIEEGKIAAVGKRLRGAGARIVDATGMIVMPGFVDTHNHLWQSLIRGCGTDRDLLGWLNACVYPLSDSQISITRSEAYAGVRLSTVDLIDTGVTTTVEWSHAFTPEFVRGELQALTDSGLRFVFAYFGRDDPAVIADIKFVKQTLIDPNPKASLQVASHPANALRADVKAMAQLARELGVQHHVHLLEHIEDRKENMFDVLAESDALGPDLLGAHGIHLTDAEIGILAAHDVRILHNPLSNMRLASGVIRLPELKRAGVQVGLGLDGGTNDASDMFNDMKAAVGLQRARTLRPDTFPTISDVLRMATVDGAKLLDMLDRVGSLTPGKQADLIILNPAKVNFAPRVDWVSQIVFNGQARNVEWVFVGGQTLKENGRLLGVNPAKIVEAAQKAAYRIQGALRTVAPIVSPADKREMPHAFTSARCISADKNQRLHAQRGAFR